MTYISTLLTKDRKTVKVWSRDKKGSRQLKKYSAPYYFFIPDENGSSEDLFGTKITRLDFNTPSEFFERRKWYNSRDIDLYEADIRPEAKVLSEEFYGADIGNLNISFFDIENDYDKNLGYATISNPYAPINSIAIYHQYSDRTVVLVVPPKTRKGYSYKDLPKDITDEAEVFICEDEKELLTLFFKEITNSDILSGWNSDFFDIPYIYERANIVLYKNAGNKLCFQGTRDPYYRDVEMYGNVNKKLCIHGRVSLDYLDVYKKFEMAEKSSYKLEHVAEEELPHLPKLSYVGSLYDLYRDDFEKFIRYNIRDTVILKGLEEKKKYISLSIQMSHMATTQIQDVLGTIKVAEQSIINFCHYILGTKVPDHTPPPPTGEKFGGATVIEPKAGMHLWTASTDLQSLYPGVMRSLNISPETIQGQFTGGHEDFVDIKNATDRKITFKMESTGKYATAPAKAWAQVIKKENWSISGAGTVFQQETDGVIPSILTTWFAERKEFKKKMAEAADAGDEKMREYYDRMQYIKKIQLNAMYGATGSIYFKFYDIRLAESTTLSGREILFHMANKIAEDLTGSYDMSSDAIIYGDTDSVYFKTYKDNVDDALDVANHACETVNNSYPEFMKNTFNCDEKHNKIMKAEQEIVADRGIYIGKKYYMLHLVADAGKKVDKMKFMGVPIKKTTLPKEIKNKLSSYIERLLKGESWDIIGPEVTYYKDTLMEMEDVSLLGLPKGINKLEQYTEKFNNNEPDLRLPGHVSAAILWNKCLQSFKDTESPRIMSGNKLSVFYLTKKIDRFKSIAVPKDINVLPDWFIENFVPIIDRKAQIYRLVDKPMEIMISVAGIKVPTKKKLKLEEGLFG